MLLIEALNLLEVLLVHSLQVLQVLLLLLSMDRLQSLDLLLQLLILRDQLTLVRSVLLGILLDDDRSLFYVDLELSSLRFGLRKHAFVVVHVLLQIVHQLEKSVATLPPLSH